MNDKSLQQLTKHQIRHPVRQHLIVCDLCRHPLRSDLNDLEAVLDTSSEAPTSNDVWLLLHPGITFDQFNPEQPAEKLNLTKAGQPGVWMLRANQ